MITTSFNDLISLVDSISQEVLTSRRAIMTQASIPFTRIAESYVAMQQNIHDGLTRGRMSSFPMETHSLPENYALKDYDGYSLSRSVMPHRSIVAGEFSNRRVELLLNAEEIQHFTGLNSAGQIPMIVRSKIEAALAPMAANFQKYIEMKFLMRNQCYACKLSDDGSTAIPFTINYLDSNATSFEIFNVLSSRARSLIGQPSSSMLHILSKKAQAALYSGTAANRLVVYADDTLTKLTKSSYMDILLDSHICPADTEIMYKGASTGMPTTDATTGNPDKARVYKISNSSLTYDATTMTFNGGTINLDVDDAGMVGKTLETGDVFFIKGSSLIKGITGYSSTEFMFPIVVGAVEEKNNARPTSFISNYKKGTFTFTAKAGGATIANLPVSICLRPMLGDANPAFMNNDPNVILNTGVANQPFASQTTIEADMNTFLKAATLIPLAGKRSHIILYPMKKIFIMSRVVSFPNSLYGEEVSTLKPSPAYMDMLQVSALPITYRFNAFGSSQQMQGKELISEIYAESAADFDNFNHNLAAIPFQYKD